MRFVPRSIPAAIALTVFAAAAAAEPLPRSAQELLERRGEMRREADVFGASPRAGKTRGAEAPPAVLPPAPPKPPPLPFGYGGSGRVNGKRVLFLERDNRSLLVEVGDIVDGTYRVDALDQNRAVLRFLPMNIAQVMVFGSQESTRPLAAAKPPRVRGPLIVDVPDEVPMDREVAVVLGIPPGSVAAKATVQLNYDETALSVTGAKIVRPGRAVVEVSAQDPAPSKALRLKALDTQASSTEIGIDIMAVDAQGRSLALKLPPHHISLVEAVN